jgi:hypothetical protein
LSCSEGPTPFLGWREDKLSSAFQLYWRLDGRLSSLVYHPRRGLAMTSFSVSHSSVRPSVVSMMFHFASSRPCSLSANLASAAWSLQVRAKLRVESGSKQSTMFSLSSGGNVKRAILVLRWDGSQGTRWMLYIVTTRAPWRSTRAVQA